MISFSSSERNFHHEYFEYISSSRALIDARLRSVRNVVSSTGSPLLARHLVDEVLDRRLQGGEGEMERLHVEGHPPLAITAGGDVAGASKSFDLVDLPAHTILSDHDGVDPEVRANRISHLVLPLNASDSASSQHLLVVP